MKLFKNNNLIQSNASYPKNSTIKRAQPKLSLLLTVSSDNYFLVINTLFML